MEHKKYFLSQDSSSHWYLVPEDKRDLWSEWLDLDENDDIAWEIPLYAKRLNRHPSFVTFENPEIKD